MSKPFRERNPVVIGAISIAVILLMLLAAFRAQDLPLIGGGDRYTAAFTEAGGLKANDEVRIAGVRVGKVESSSSTATTSRSPSGSRPTRRSAPRPAPPSRSRPCSAPCTSPSSRPAAVSSPRATRSRSSAPPRPSTSSRRSPAWPRPPQDDRHRPARRRPDHAGRPDPQHARGVPRRPGGGLARSRPTSPPRTTGSTRCSPTSTGSPPCSSDRDQDIIKLMQDSDVLFQALVDAATRCTTCSSRPRPSRPS